MHSNYLVEVDIPDSVTTIKGGAFMACTSLKEIVIPDSVTEILTYGSWGAFSGCTSLEDVKLGNGVTKIGTRAFSGCTNLEHINLPNNITTYGGEAFYNCPKLTKVGVGISEGIELEDGLTKIVYEMFYGANNITEVSLPDSVITIERRAFAKCTNLQSIIYKNNSHTTESSLKSAGITSIAYDSFEGTNITKE